MSSDQCNRVGALACDVLFQRGLFEFCLITGGCGAVCGVAPVTLAPADVPYEGGLGRRRRCAAAADEAQRGPALDAGQGTPQQTRRTSLPLCDRLIARALSTTLHQASHPSETSGPAVVASPAIHRQRMVHLLFSFCLSLFFSLPVPRRPSRSKCTWRNARARTLQEVDPSPSLLLARSLALIPLTPSGLVRNNEDSVARPNTPGSSVKIGGLSSVTATPTKDNKQQSAVPGTPTSSAAASAAQSQSNGAGMAFTQSNNHASSGEEEEA